MNHLEPAPQIPTFRSTEIAHQYAMGLLSLQEAEVFDILMAQGVFSSFNAEGVIVHNHQSTAGRDAHHGVLLSQIHLHCFWEAIPTLQQWIHKFLSARQSGVVVIPSKEVSDGLLIIGSTAQDLQGTLAERVAKHLVEEGQITSYRLYGADDAVTCLLQTQ